MIVRSSRSLVFLIFAICFYNSLSGQRLLPLTWGLFLCYLFLHLMLIHNFQARIKKIMQADEDVGKIALAVPVLVCESSSYC